MADEKHCTKQKPVQPASVQPVVTPNPEPQSQVPAEPEVMKDRTR